MQTSSLFFRRLASWTRGADDFQLYCMSRSRRQHYTGHQRYGKSVGNPPYSIQLKLMTVTRLTTWEPTRAGTLRHYQRIGTSFNFTWCYIDMNVSLSDFDQSLASLEMATALLPTLLFVGISTRSISRFQLTQLVFSCSHCFQSRCSFEWPCKRCMYLVIYLEMSLKCTIWTQISATLSNWRLIYIDTAMIDDPSGPLVALGHPKLIWGLQSVYVSNESCV